MLSEQEKKDLLKKKSELNIEINSLRKNLNQINDQKESAFEKKEKVAHSISSLISQVKSSKSQRDNLTKKVKQVKVGRSEYNKEIKQKIEEIKVLNKKKQEIQKKHNIKGDPSYIKKEIEKLESKIETEVMSFDKEKQLMKAIKDLRKKYNEAKVISDVFDKIHKVEKELDRLKEESNKKHKEVQKNAQNSQQKHEELIETSHEINELKGKEEEAYKKFFETKIFPTLNEIMNKLLEIENT